ncbi:amino acid/amide ABC transporter substrate-binding protein, HAAT family (TC 3.A.1.4.-) [Klenkia soli]|uniref:Amino acid/amide ABC transporter substrate-binding protein, HAAT family (TC 3.A.1.4.-) n=1 Tax=Klenkia soli TaxID=1052260 RepID=A0A1H0LZR7_9ACTN|nr:amino acid/amide ABC transporter substrate-binding protein, HAAT family (TC 3.A.1.4.-) [Klenkia soli]
MNRSTRPVKWVLPLVLASALALSACSNASSDDDAAGSSSGGLAGGGSGETYRIAFEGPLSGDNQQLGINEVNAVELAIEQANDSGDLGFTLELVRADDQGDPAIAPTAAASVLQDDSILGVVGPSFSGATKAVATTYGEANMAMISPSATNDTLTTSGYPTFHRVVPPDSLEGTQLADYLATKNYSSMVVIDDLSDYGKGVADVVQSALEGAGVQVTRLGVDAKTTDYGATAQQVASSGAQAVFYGGYDAQAAQLAQALQTAGFEGDKYTGNGGKSSVFTDGAGDAGNGWYFSCGCSDAVTSPDAQDFTAAYKAKFNTDPSTYSPEAYDAANAMIEAIKTAAEDGAPTRESVEDAVNDLNYTGITTTVAFDENGELEASSQVINLFQQENGVITLLGNIKEQ